MNRYLNWEKGFDLYDQGKPIEACDTGHPTQSKARKKGWLASQRVSELMRDQEAVGVLTDRWKQIREALMM